MNTFIRSSATLISAATSTGPTSKTSRHVRPGNWMQATIAFLLLSFSASVLAQSATVFEKPPSPEELANILYPRKMRGIVVDGDTDGSGGNNGKTRLFAMLINFEFGKTDIVKESLPFLDAVGEMLNLDKMQDKSIVIEGHTDAVGGNAFNQKLSEKRALAIRRYLVSRYNIDEGRLYPIGKGETELHNSEDPKSATNRRVQFRPLDRAKN